MSFWNWKTAFGEGTAVVSEPAAVCQSIARIAGTRTKSVFAASHPCALDVPRMQPTMEWPDRVPACFFELGGMAAIPHFRATAHFGCFSYRTSRREAANAARQGSVVGTSRIAGGAPPSCGVAGYVLSSTSADRTVRCRRRGITAAATIAGHVEPPSQTSKPSPRGMLVY